MCTCSALSGQWLSLNLGQGEESGDRGGEREKKWGVSAEAEAGCSLPRGAVCWDCYQRPEGLTPDHRVPSHLWYEILKLLLCVVILCVYSA